MIMIEIGVDVDEGPRLNMMIGGRAQSLVKPRWPVEPATKDADIDHKARLRCVDRAGDDPNSSPRGDRQQALKESTNVGTISDVSHSRGPKLGVWERW